MQAGKQSHDSRLTLQCCFQTRFSRILKPLTIFAESSIVDVQQGSKQASDMSLEFVIYGDDCFSASDKLIRSL